MLHNLLIVKHFTLMNKSGCNLQQKWRRTDVMGSLPQDLIARSFRKGPTYPVHTDTDIIPEKIFGHLV